MTVCIAALSSDDKYVCVADEMITAGDTFQHTGEMKINLVGDKCITAYSGDPTQAFTVWAKAVTKLEDGKRTFAQIKYQFEIAYEEVRTAWLNRYLKRWGIDSLGEFTKNGMAWFGEPRFSNMWTDVQREWDLDILLSGFGDEEKYGFVMTLCEPGISELCIDRQVASIGSGSDAADTMLSHTYSRKLNAYELTARLLEAKFAAETNPYVSKETRVLVVDASGNQWSMNQKAIEVVQKVWEKSGKAYSTAAAKKISTLFREVGKG